jgi:sodium/bile acid cotransporter 3/5
VAHVTTTAGAWGITFEPAELLLPMDSISTVNFSTELKQEEIGVGVVHVITSDARIASPNPTDKAYILRTETVSDLGSWSSAFNVSGNFLGYASVHLQLSDNNSQTVLKSSNPVSVKVVRSERVIDQIFTYSVAVLVSIIYINFGCALDWSVFKKTVRMPLGPIIGFASQFLVMPLVSSLFLYEVIP